MVMSRGRSRAVTFVLGARRFNGVDDVGTSCPRWQWRIEA
jgi:hypothetical protein